jgi:hypothetical protein
MFGIRHDEKAVIIAAVFLNLRVRKLDNVRVVTRLSAAVRAGVRARYGVLLRSSLGRPLQAIMPLISGEWQPAGGKTCMSMLRPG